MTTPTDQSSVRPPLGRRVHFLGHLWDTVVVMIAGCWLLWILAMAPGRLGQAIFAILMVLVTSVALRALWWRFVTSKRSHTYEVQPPLYWLRGKAAN